MKARQTSSVILVTILVVFCGFAIGEDTIEHPFANTDEWLKSIKERVNILLTDYSDYRTPSIQKPIEGLKKVLKNTEIHEDVAKLEEERICTVGKSVGQYRRLRLRLGPQHVVREVSTCGIDELVICCFPKPLSVMKQIH
ncbi:uncharacterized protein LOC141855688 [Brevipalpus obovatus]|uniref:uncharacterized protein LOC141855688 n=1 Tax=Brevipalpus obovatus TaxID=246614 RepID=UPI003D9F12AE